MQNNTGLKQIVIPSTITSIGNFSFCKCSSLTKVFIPSSVTSIGKHAFGGCSLLTQITIPSSITSIGNSAFFDCPFNTFYSLVKQFLDNPNQLKNGLSILSSITYSVPDDELDNILEIASKFLFNEDEEIRIKSFILIDKLIMRTSNGNEYDEQISSLIEKYSNYLFELNKNDKESEKFIKKITDIISLDIELSLDFMSIEKKVEQIIFNRKIDINYRIKCFPLIEVTNNKLFVLNNDLLPKILQLILDACKNYRLSDNYLFCETFLKQYATDNEYSINFFKENIDKLCESKKLYDRQVALYLIKVLIISMSLEECVNYIDLVLKIGDCEDETIIHHCIAVFSDFIDDFNESLVIKFNQISEFLLKNINNSDSLITLSNLIKSVHKTPDYFTNVIDSLLLKLKSQKKSKSIEVLKCINSCFLSGINLISPFDKPYESAAKVFEIINERMNSKEFIFELPILLKILGNLVFYSPELIKNNLDKIVKVYQLNLMSPKSLLEYSNCIRKIASYLPDSILPYIPNITQPMLELISKINPEKLENLENDDNLILCTFKVISCLCQIGLSNEEFAIKYDELLWNIFNYNIEFCVLSSSSANFFAKRGFPIEVLLDSVLENLIIANASDLSLYLKAIQQLILSLTEEQISFDELMTNIEKTLITAGTGILTNFFISEWIAIIPNKLFRQLFNCFLAYVDIYQKQLNSQINILFDGLEMDFINTSNLKCIQFLHFLAKILMICRSEFNDNKVINKTFYNVILNYKNILNKRPIDTEKFAHILISIIYLIRTRNEFLYYLLEKEIMLIESLIQIDSNDNLEFIIIRQTFVLNIVMFLDLPIDDDVKKILNDIKLIKNMEVIPLLADCFVYIFKIIGDEMLPLMKKFATIVFSSERYVLKLIDDETLEFYRCLMKSIKQEELLFYTNLNESSIHQIAFNT